MLKSKALQRNIMAVAIVLLWFSNYIYVPFLSTYAASVGASLPMVGLIIGSYGLIQMLLRIPIGVLSDTIKNRRLFLFLAMISSLISGTGFFFLSSPVLLLLFRALAGLAVSNWAIYITTFSVLGDSQRNSKAIGTVNSLSAIGNISAFILGGFVAQYINVKSTFLVSILSSSLGLILLLFVEETYEQKEDKKKNLIHDFIIVFKDSKLLFYSGIAILFQIISSSSLIAFVPTLFSEAGASELQKSLGTTLASIPGIFAGPLAVGLFSKKMGSNLTNILSFIILSVPMFFFAYVQDITILLALQFIAGFGKGMLMALLMSRSTSHLPDEARSTALSIYQAIYSIGMFIGPAMTGAISSMFSLQVAFVCLGLIGIVAIIALLIYNPSEKHVFCSTN